MKATRFGARGWSTGAKLIGFLLCVLLTGLGLWFSITSARPLGVPQAAPNAAQVAAARDAYQQFRAAQGNKKGIWVVLGPVQLAGLGALASDGFRPDRLNLATYGSELRVAASHHLPMNRWLNVNVRAQGPAEHFPETRIQVGAWSIPPSVSRIGLQAARWLLHLRNVDVPPLDSMVRQFKVQNGTVTALLSMSDKSGLLDQAAGAVALPVDGDQVLRIYCALATAQRQKPSAEFAEQVRRAFSLQLEATTRVTYNGAAFVALGMLLVDDRVGDFGRLTHSDLGQCRIAPIAVQIYGRSDWPKHWALSAALAVGAGTQLSQAAGQWKELADSLARESQFSIGDPSGFSMVDLAADRAGFQVARAATQAERAERLAEQLRNVGEQQLLPHQLTKREDGLTNRDFTQRYGGVDDPRFHQRVREIDALLNTSGLR